MRRYVEIYGDIWSVMTMREAPSYRRGVRVRVGVRVGFRVRVRVRVGVRVGVRVTMREAPSYRRTPAASQMIRMEPSEPSTCRGDAGRCRGDVGEM